MGLVVVSLAIGGTANFFYGVFVEKQEVWSGGASEKPILLYSETGSYWRWIGANTRDYYQWGEYLKPGYRTYSPPISIECGGMEVKAFVSAPAADRKYARMWEVELSDRGGYSVVFKVLNAEALFDWAQRNTDETDPRYLVSETVCAYMQEEVDKATKDVESLEQFIKVRNELCVTLADSIPVWIGVPMLECVRER